MSPWAVRVVATLGIADRMASGVTELAALAHDAAVDPEALGRVLRYLAVRGVFAETEPGRFELTPSARLLQRRRGAGLQPLLDLDGLGLRLDLALCHLLDVVRTGEPAYEQVFGRSFWDDLAAHPEAGSAFDDAMGLQAARAAEAVVEDEVWPAATHVVDVGGGSGGLLARLLRAHPHLRGTLVDLPGPLSRAPAVLAGAGVDCRSQLVEASFFDALPAGADVYVLSSVLHDWNDADAGAIVARCAEAAGGTGTVLVVEALAEDLPPREATALDLRMLVNHGGRVRRLDQLVVLVEDHGLAVGTVRRGGGRTVAHLVPTAPTVPTVPAAAARAATGAVR